MSCLTGMCNWSRLGPLQAHAHARALASMHAHAHPFMLLHSGTHARKCIHTHKHTHTQAHTHTHTHRHTHKRRTKTWICETHGHPPCRACATTHRGVRHCCSRGHQGHPRVPTECPVAANRTPARVLGGRRISQRTPMGRGGGTAAHPRPQTACAAHADECGPTPGGAEGPRRGRSRPAGGQKTAGTRTPLPESERPCKWARLRGRPVERHGRAGTEAS